jgi:transposase
VTDGKLGIDVSKNTLDASLSSDNKTHAKSFANSSDGWRHLLNWLIARKMRRVHACLESTGLYSLGIACALYDAGHVVSIVNPAQIRDFARTKLGRNKTDGVDASHIREYCELFKPQPWAPPSAAHRRLAELQTIRAGIGQHGAVDESIAQTIDNDSGLRRKAVCNVQGTRVRPS